MAASVAKLDVLVLGEHPATYLAAALLRHKTKLRVVHATIPGEAEPDRLVIVNPALSRCTRCSSRSAASST